MATIQDVARDAGVSTATVSRVFSAPELVLEPTRLKVMEAVTRLGYEPNFAAKSLRTLRTEKILVTVPDISNPFFSQVIRGVEEAALAAGYSVLLGDTRH
ncbi:MAG TPA: LacI family DNA-binding transcriptional regulator, partial [Caulobacter sp.]|nr:LacI family DNA-binding transcriptional regulator [Caulobacter sp.]